MTKKLIKIDGYWIVVENKRPKDFGDYWIYISEYPFIIIKSNNSTGWFEKLHDKNNYWTVIFSQNPEHNLRTVQFSDEVAKELGIIDVRSKLSASISHTVYGDYWVGGYNQCLADNADKKFTLEDMMNLAGYCAAMDNRRPIENLKEEAEYYIQSLTKQEYFCELDKVELVFTNADSSIITLTHEGVRETYLSSPKITNNSVTVTKIWK